MREGGRKRTQVLQSRALPAALIRGTEPPRPTIAR
jgi:hypothetical protein